MTGSSIPPPPPPHASAHIQEDLEHASSTSTTDASNTVRTYDPAVILSSQQAHMKQEAEPEEKVSKEGKDVVPAEIKTQGMDTKGRETSSSDTEKDVENRKRKENKNIRNKVLRKAIVHGRWWEVESILKKDKALATEAINSDGNTVLHIAVGIGRGYIVREILSLIDDEKLPYIVNLDKRTALHIAAMVGNTEAVGLLLRKNRNLLNILDNRGETALDKAFENMDRDTNVYLLKAADDYENKAKTKEKSLHLEESFIPRLSVRASLLVSTVSAKQYELATSLLHNNPRFVMEANILMALVTNFPSGLDYCETLIYPLMPGDICERIVDRARGSFEILVDYHILIMDDIEVIPVDVIFGTIKLLLHLLLKGPLAMLAWIYSLIRLLMLMLYFPFFMFYFLFWMVATRLGVPPIKHIEKKMKEWKEAKEVLELVCDEVDKLEFPDGQLHFYTKPILEAACQNVYEVVDEILMRCPEAIGFKDESGHDVIQSAIIHRSEKIYNIIYTIGERRSIYRTIQDCDKNNMLHLVGKLPPLQTLRRSRGPALQLQRELQWRQEVERLVLPICITQENNFEQTPDMVFEKGHDDLVREAEKWMKAVAESCSITAALITTIVFAAAITVPGGTDQTTGFPLFTKNISFTIFAMSDAISLFSSTTALLMFLSILTGSFDEKDFVVTLPRRLMIGLSTLMLSTTAMMVAFAATLFLVFCHKRHWMLTPICVLSSVPIATFGTLQIPLIVDLYRSTYMHPFIKQKKNKLD